MTLEETRDVFAVMQLNYPDNFKGLSDDLLVATIRFWQSMFANEPKELVLGAVTAHVQTSTDRFMPNVGVIKEEIRKLTAPKGLSEMEAWGLVANALRNGYYGYKEEYEKLPPAVQRCVGSATQLREWAVMDAETLQSVVASNFQRSFRAIAREEAEWAKLPPGFREEMQKLSGAIFKPLELKEGDT